MNFILQSSERRGKRDSKSPAPPESHSHNQLELKKVMKAQLLINHIMKKRLKNHNPSQLSRERPGKRSFKKKSRKKVSNIVLCAVSKKRGAPSFAPLADIVFRKNIDLIKHFLSPFINSNNNYQYK